jgi:hypothetical protein
VEEEVVVVVEVVAAVVVPMPSGRGMVRGMALEVVRAMVVGEEKLVVVEEEEVAAVEVEVGKEELMALGRVVDMDPDTVAGRVTEVGVGMEVVEVVVAAEEEVEVEAQE